MHDVHISSINPVACEYSNALAKRNVLGEDPMSTNKMKNLIIENVNDNHMNDVINSSSSQTNLEQIPLILNKNVSLNQSSTLDAPLEDTTTKAFLANGIDDYSNDGGDCNDLHSLNFDYLYQFCFYQP